MGGWCPSPPLLLHDLRPIVALHKHPTAHDTADELQLDSEDNEHQYTAGLDDTNPTPDLEADDYSFSPDYSPPAPVDTQPPASLPPVFIPLTSHVSSLTSLSSIKMFDYHINSYAHHATSSHTIYTLSVRNQQPAKST